MEILFEQLHNLQKLQPLQLSPGYNNLVTKSIEFIIYKVLLKVNKISILIEKWAKNIKQKFIEKVTMVNKYTYKYSYALIMKKLPP